MRARLCLLLALWSAACAEPDPGFPDFERALEGVLATVAGSSGDLSVKHAGEGVWEPASTAAVLYPGDWLRTGRGAGAHVEFLSGGALDLEEEAVVVIEALKPLERTRPDAPASAPLVAVQSGAIRSTLSDRAGRQRPLVVRTADGAEARLERRGDGPAELKVASVEGETELSVAEGEVELSAEGKAERLEAGGALSVGKKGARKLSLPRRPGLLAPGADARVQAGAVTLRWQPGDGATLFRVQVAKDSVFRGVWQTQDLEATELSLEAPVGVHHWRVAARDASGRQGPWSAARRLFCEKEAPRDWLLAPAPGASFGHADAPPSIAFQWAPREGARAYRLVVSRSADLAAPVVSEVTGEGELRVSTLGPGEYFWGVYLQGAGLEPLFLTPRKLSVKKVSGARVVAPKRIRKWGE